MTLPVLFALCAIVCLALGFSRGMPLALILGAFLMVDAVVAYLTLGPVAQMSHTLLGGH